MKKLGIKVLPLILMVLVVAGCSVRKPTMQASPGSVLGGDQDQAAVQKVVTFDVVGKGLEPEHALTKGEAKLMAERAAIADGYRKMVEKIRGVYVEAFMKAGYGKVNEDLVSTRTQSWLRGVEVTEVREARYGITEALMRLNVYFAKEDMVWWPTGIGPNVSPVEDKGILRSLRTGS